MGNELATPAPNTMHKAFFLGTNQCLLCFEWNLIRLGGPAHGIVTKTVHKTLTGDGEGQRVGVVGIKE